MSVDIDPTTLTLADLKQTDPPPAKRRGSTLGLVGKFRELIKQNPGVWYEYPKLVSSRGSATTHNADGNYEWVQRTVKDDQGHNIGLRLYCRYTGE